MISGKAADGHEGEIPRVLKLLINEDQCENDLQPIDLRIVIREAVLGRREQPPGEMLTQRVMPSLLVLDELRRLLFHGVIGDQFRKCGARVPSLSNGDLKQSLECPPIASGDRAETSRIEAHNGGINAHVLPSRVSPSERPTAASLWMDLSIGSTWCGSAQ